MLTQALFELPPLASPLPHPAPNQFFSPPLLSHRCAHLRPHLLSFEIHPQNTRGWGIYLSGKKFSSSPVDPLSLLFSALALRPLPPVLPLPPLSPFSATFLPSLARQRRGAKRRVRVNFLVTSLSAVLTRHPCANSFRCHSYAKTLGGLTIWSTNPSRNGTEAGIPLTSAGSTLCAKGARTKVLEKIHEEDFARAFDRGGDSGAGGVAGGKGGSAGAAGGAFVECHEEVHQGGGLCRGRRIDPRGVQRDGRGAASERRSEGGSKGRRDAH